MAPDGAGHVKTAVLFTATARNVAESASNYRVSCGSIGVLEQLMLDRMAQRLTKARIDASGQQMRGSCSPGSMSTTRRPPIPVCNTTSPG